MREMQAIVIHDPVVWLSVSLSVCLSHCESRLNGWRLRLSEYAWRLKQCNTWVLTSILDLMWPSPDYFVHLLSLRRTGRCAGSCYKRTSYVTTPSGHLNSQSERSTFGNADSAFRTSNSDETIVSRAALILLCILTFVLMNIYECVKDVTVSSAAPWTDETWQFVKLSMYLALWVKWQIFKGHCQSWSCDQSVMLWNIHESQQRSR